MLEAVSMNPKDRDLNFCFASHFSVNEFVKWDAYLLTLEILAEQVSIKYTVIRVGIIRTDTREEPAEH